MFPTHARLHWRLPPPSFSSLLHARLAPSCPSPAEPSLATLPSVLVLAFLRVLYTPTPTPPTTPAPCDTRPAPHHSNPTNSSLASSPFHPRRFAPSASGPTARAGIQADPSPPHIRACVLVPRLPPTLPTPAGACFWRPTPTPSRPLPRLSLVLMPIVTLAHIPPPFKSSPTASRS